MASFADFSMPHDTEAEAMVLASALVDRLAAAKVVERVRTADLYHYRNRVILDAMRRIFGQEPIEVMSVRAALEAKGEALEEAGGLGYLFDLAGSIPTVAHIDWAIGRVLELSERRQVINAALKSAALAADLDQKDPRAKALGLLMSIQAGNGMGTRERLSNVARDVVLQAERTADAVREQRSTGLFQTGLYDLDKKLRLTAGGLLILAARPGMGKTSALLTIAANVAEREPVLVFSLEMSKEQLARRVIALMTGVTVDQQLTGNVDEQGWGDLANGLAKIEGLELYIDDRSTPTIGEMRAAAVQLEAQLGRPLGLIGVDYLQLIGSEHVKGQQNNRTAEVGAVARGLKQLAKDSRCPLMALSQLSRGVEQRQDKRPMLSDLRESGDIEAAADVVTFIYRDEYYAKQENRESTRPGVADFILAKHRDGAVTDIPLIFEASLTRFRCPTFGELPSDMPPPLDSGGGFPKGGPRFDNVPYGFQGEA